MYLFSLSMLNFYLQNLVLYSTFMNSVFGWRPRQPAINPQCIYSLSQQHWSLVGVLANKLCILIAFGLLVNNLISINKFLCTSPHLQIWSLVGVLANQLFILIAFGLLVNNLISINKFLCISPHLQINLKLILPIRIIYIFVISI
jgi:hypothetical protein